MLLPQTAEYALRAVLHLARHPERSVRVPEMADEIGVPRNYLSKTLHQLARAGVLDSTRGPAGGFRLGVAADRLTLERVVAVFQAPGDRKCLLANRPCGADPSCPVHARWAPVAERLDHFFGTTTIADLTRSPSADPLDVLGALEVEPPPFRRAEDAPATARSVLSPTTRRDS